MKRIDLSEIGGATAAQSTGSDKHELALDSEGLALLEQWAKVNPLFKTLKNQCETLSKQVAAKIKAAFFTRFNGVGVPTGTLIATTTKGVVKFILKNAYSKKFEDWSALEGAIGKENAKKHFTWRTSIEFKLDALPEDQQEKFADALVKLAKDKNAVACVTAKQYIAPRAGFHEARTTLLSTEQNAKLDALIPVTAYPMF
jgi:hypothetical protein